MEYIASFLVRDPASSMHYSPLFTSARTMCVRSIAHLHWRESSADSNIKTVDLPLISIAA